MPNFPPLSVKPPHTIPYPKWHLQLKICRLPDLDRFGPNGWASFSLVLRSGNAFGPGQWRIWPWAQTRSIFGESFEIWATRRSRKRLLWSLPPIQAIDHTWNPQNAVGSGAPFGCDLPKLLWCLRWASPKYRGWPCQQFAKVLPLHQDTRCEKTGRQVVVVQRLSLESWFEKDRTWTGRSTKYLLVCSSFLVKAKAQGR